MKLTLREYQEQGADWIYEHDRSLILARMGAGKTAMAITAMRDMLDDAVVKRWLVIAPKRVCTDVWPQEISLWAKGMTHSVAVGTPQARQAAINGHADVVIINYENLQWLSEEHPDLSKLFGGIVFDELTRLKTPGNPRSKSTTKQKKGKRYEAIYRAILDINIRIGLTGSFTSNGLEDVFGQTRMVDSTILGSSRGAFLQKYFWSADPKMGDWHPRPQALENITDRIKPIAFILENKEYADTLPPLNFIETRCTMEMTAYNKMKRDFVLELGGDLKAIAAHAGAVTQKLAQLSCGWVYQSESEATDTPGKFKKFNTPHWFSTHKFDMLDELLCENRHEPTLVWYWYKEELAELNRRYPKLQTLDTPNAVNRWNSGQIDLLAAHPMSASHGLNLQGQSTMVFLTLPWSLELFEQAVARLHRSGQKHAVQCYLLLTKGTIDEKMWAALKDKKSLAEIAIEALK